MLIEFSVGNYKSFKEIKTLSMVASDTKSYFDEIDETNVFSAGDLRLVKSAAIYGANASGKSNLVKAMEFSKDMIIHSLNSSLSNKIFDKYDYFKLNPEYFKKPAYFQFIILIEGKKYRYGFEVGYNKTIVSEWLFITENKKEYYCFTREDNVLTINSNRLKKAKSLENLVRQNVLFLSVMASYNIPVALEIINLFDSIILNTYIKDISDSSLQDLFLNKEFSRKFLLKLIKKIDFSINEIEKYPVSTTNESVNNGKIDDFIIFSSHNVYDNAGKIIDEALFEFYKNESFGTQRFISLAAYLYDTLKGGGILVIDELESSLHPHIAQTIIKLFHSNETNPNNAQLIFTTHNTNLLDPHLFRKDQIWFTEKDKTEATDLYSLVEFNEVKSDVAKDFAYEKNYLQGRYGAIPFIGRIDNLFIKSDE